MNKKIKLLLAVLILILIIRLSLPGLGHVLVVNDELEKSDIIVVLMGGGYDRILEAIDLYSAGYASRIIMVQNYTNGYEALCSKGIASLREPEINKMIGIQAGVPSQAFTVLPGNALSTQDEALVVKEYLKQNVEIKSIILVTSKYHSGRAKIIFNKSVSTLNRPVKIQADASKYDELYHEIWWRHRETIKTVALEYLKLANFYLREQFQI